MKIFNQRPMTYACIYLLLIPVFTSIYLLNIDGFYQSTVRQEGTLKNYKYDLHNEIYKLFSKRLKLNNKEGPYIDIGFYYFFFNINFNITERTIDCFGSFPISIYNYKKIEREKYSRSLECDLYFKLIPVYNEILGLGFSSQYDEPVKIEFGLMRDAEIGNIHDAQAYNDTSNPYDGNILNFFRSNVQIVKTENGKYILTASETESKSIFRLLKLYLDAKNGKPTVGGSDVVRMLYFSIVTITTLGYGDIVPITDVARLMVSIESILGVVLIGLFLNSLSWRK